jgi:transporter family protein
MKSYVLFAACAGILWGLGGYFEKTGLKLLGIPPIAGITLRTAVAVVVLSLLSIPVWRSVTIQPNPSAWIMMIVGGGIVAGSLGMWSFYTSLSTTENLGVTLAVAFALSPLTGTVVGLVRGDQPMNLKLALGLTAIVAGIVLIQLSDETYRS